MNEKNGEYGKTLRSLAGSPVVIKIIAIGILTLLLVKPATMIESLITEREHRQKGVVGEIGSKWGREQTVIGPIISVPYKSQSGGDTVHYMHFLPENLQVNGQVYPEIRYRGIFEAVVYKAHLVLTGHFSYPDPAGLNIPDDDIDWAGATMSLGISDMRGIRDQIEAKVNNAGIVMNPGLATDDLMPAGVDSRMALYRITDHFPFRLVVNLRGSETISFVPTGKVTAVSLSSPWPNPSFSGAYLPSERSVSEKGFQATWKVLDLNRDYPQEWKGKLYKNRLKGSSFGVGLFTPVDFYQKSMRTVKYAILFVVLTFTAFFISEIASATRLHPVQYLLIGLAIIAFYTLLVSLSEHVGFRTAYGLAAGAVILLVAAYAKSILKSGKLAIVVGGVLVLVYGYSYWLVQMVDYALVAGSVGLFIILGIIMFATRKIDWYAIKIPSSPDEQPPKPEDPKLDEEDAVLEV